MGVSVLGGPKIAQQLSFWFPFKAHKKLVAQRMTAPYEAGEGRHLYPVGGQELPYLYLHGGPGEDHVSSGLV